MYLKLYQINFLLSRVLPLQTALLPTLSRTLHISNHSNQSFIFRYAPYNMSVEPFQVNITNLTDFDSKWKSMVNDSIPIPTPDSLIYQNSIGAFEGGGYAKKKIYRPTYDCKMRSNRVEYFCPVCEKAIIEMINFYCK